MLVAGVQWPQGLQPTSRAASDLYGLAHRNPSALCQPDMLMQGASAPSDERCLHPTKAALYVPQWHWPLHADGEACMQAGKFMQTGRCAYMCIRVAERPCVERTQP